MIVAVRLAKGLNYLAAAVAIYAALFYWSRGWIGLSPTSIPWVIYSLTPYLLFWVMSVKLLGHSSTKQRIIVFVVASAILLLTTSYVYLQFTDESLVFYLRKVLFYFPVLSTVLVAVFVGVGSLLTKTSRRPI